MSRRVGRGRWALPVILGALAACTAEPASVAFERPLPTLLMTAAPVPLPPLVVRDARGTPITPVPPGIVLAVEPASVAMVEAGRAVALDNGDAAWVVRLGTRVLARAPFQVRLVDRIELECPRPHCSIAVGEQLTLVPRLFSRGATVAPSVELAWRMAPAAILTMPRPGRFAGLSPGLVVVTVEAGAARASREVSVTGPLDRVRIECPPAYLAAPVAGAAPVCTLRQGVQVRLEPRGSGGGQPIHELTAEWHSSDETVATVESGLVYTNNTGATEITARVGNIHGTLPVRVVEACRGEWQLYIIGYGQKLYCRGPRAVRCAAELYREDHVTDVALDECCCTLQAPLGMEPAPYGRSSRRRR